MLITAVTNLNEISRGSCEHYNFLPRFATGQHCPNKTVTNIKYYNSVVCSEVEVKPTRHPLLFRFSQVKNTCSRALGIIPHESFSCRSPSMVNVFPDPVCP